MLQNGQFTFFKWHELLLFALLLLFGLLIAFETQGQTRRSNPAHGSEATQIPEEPAYHAYKGVAVGATQAEARQKLGEPSQKADDLDIFVFSQSELAQVYYDAAGHVTAISVDYMGGVGAPSATSVLGMQPDNRPDGSSYKLVRYPRLGFWVSYNRTVGDTPTVTITIQKIER